MAVSEDAEITAMLTAANTNQSTKLDAFGPKVLSQMVDYRKAPHEGMAENLQRYLEEGIEPSAFLKALLTNDLRRAMELGGATEVAAWLSFFEEALPVAAWGSAGIVRRWMKHCQDARCSFEPQVPLAA